MTRRIDAETAIIGSGFAGVLVARELLASGRDCVMIERGSMVPWEEQVRDERWESDSPASTHNHVNDPSGVDFPWAYVYAVGGSGNRWAGTSPRLLPEDFEMGSRHGVMEDWPISYADLAPHYRAAERALGISGAATDLLPGTDYPLRQHPFGRQDRAVAPYLEPFIPLPQARPSEAVGGRPACCGSTTCQLCPVNARASVLNTIGAVLEDERLRLLADTIAVRFAAAPGGRRVRSVQCVTAANEPVEVRAERFVLAANGIESPALLLRSELGGPNTGRYLASHPVGKLLVRTDEPVGPGYGTSLLTGASYAYYASAPRSERAAALLLPYNPGATLAELDVVGRVRAGLAAGERPARVRRRIVGEWERTLAFDVFHDQEPKADNRVRLGARRDRYGIPQNVVRFGPPTPYEDAGTAHVAADVPRRLRPLGARLLQFHPRAGGGGHILGTLRMSARPEDGVIDPDLRHHRIENLFVSGGAVFPTYSPSHPTMTISALAVRLGRTLAGT